MKVFVSYAREDAAIAERLYRDLKTHLIKPWMDVTGIEPGSNWDDTIKGKITESACFLALVSDTAKSKDYVQQEWALALKQDCTFIPVRIADCALPGELEKLQWVDPQTDYEGAVGNLLRKLHRDAKTCHFEEHFSSLGPDDLEAWDFGQWELSDLDHTGDNGQSLAGAVNRDAKTATLTVNVGDAKTLTYWRRFELSGANFMAEASFTVTLDAGGQQVIEEHKQALGSEQDEWSEVSCDLSGLAGKDARLRFQVQAKDTMSVVTTAKAWIDDIRVN